MAISGLGWVTFWEKLWWIKGVGLTDLWSIVDLSLPKTQNVLCMRLKVGVRQMANNLVPA